MHPEWSEVSWTFLLHAECKQKGVQKRFIDFKKKKVSIYDPLNRERKNDREMVFNFLKAQYEEKKPKKKIDFLQFKFPFEEKAPCIKSRVQDCGIIAIKNAEYLSRNDSNDKISRGNCDLIIIS